ncbi:hypothetical protein C2869_11905 [Saccharobesus litoralis]|uniref:Exopolysaccharide biosynthesis protein YbjH n=1 Tax=Saccharobesus litoralis TaxID=2172099 RepID=A0A2S0VSE3_9ALTE|nr:YjbH domain-containing protein [Saccharobesus litoralis]AWB67092.1 hypothetical protein C2869_11905 [Saccharobesus litoralis]
MKKLALTLGITSILLTNTCLAVDEKINFQGITGAVNTPSANTLQPGSFNFFYSKPVERGNRYLDNHSFVYSFGLYDFLEVSGRNASYSSDLGKGSDLSANIKLKASFIPKDWFSLAIGSQDLGGAANNYGADYVVLSKSLFDDSLSISAGVAKSDSLLGRMNGEFGSIRYQPFEWLQLQADYDAADTHTGLVFSTPLAWLNNQAQFNASIITSSSNEDLTDNVSYGIGFTLPMGSSIPTSLAHSSEYEIQQSNAARTQVQVLSGQQENRLFEQLKSFKQGLIDFGLEDISVGYDVNNKVFVRATTLSTFGRNRLDAVGYILGTLVNEVTASKESQFVLEITENGLVAESYSGQFAQYHAFLQQTSTSTGLRVIKGGQSQTANVNWIGEQKQNSSWFKPRITLSPDVNSTVGTEVGVLDFSVALAARLELDLWSGATFSSKYLKQFYETKDFKDGYILANSRQNSGLYELGLHQSWTLPFNIFNMTSVGRYRENWNYISHEAYWASQSGRNIFQLKLGRYELDKFESQIDCITFYKVCREAKAWEEANTPKERDVAVASYKHYVPEYDLLLRAEAGQFWQADTGFTLQLERQFGDTTVRLRYKNTDAESGVNNEFIGLSFSVPLTPRKDYNFKHVTLRGENKWTYGIDTLIGKNHNRLTPGTADIAYVSTRNLANIYFNNFRSGQAYLERNKARLIDAYLTFKDQ